VRKKGEKRERESAREFFILAFLASVLERVREGERKAQRERGAEGERESESNKERETSFCFFCKFFSS